MRCSVRQVSANVHYAMVSVLVIGADCSCDPYKGIADTIVQ
jgi:hypothetical protein